MALRADSESAQFERLAGCRLPARLSVLRPAILYMAEDLRKRGVPELGITDVALAATEALNNAVIHACHEDPTHYVELEWSWEGDQLTLHIQDPGEFVPGPSQGRTPPAPEAESGRGLYLMNQLMESVEHQLSPHGHVVLMKRTFHPPSWKTSTSLDLPTELRKIAQELCESYEVISSLFRLGEILGTAGNVTTLAQIALSEIARITSADCCCIRLVNDRQQLELTAGLPMGMTFPALVDELHSVENQVFRSGEDACIENWGSMKNDPIQTIAASAFVTPIRHGDKILGTVAIGRRANRSYFQAGQTNVTRMVSEFLGIVQSLSLVQQQRNKDLLTLRDLELAASLQRSLVPDEFPPGPWFQLSGASIPARQVGGDYFDVLEVGKDGLLLIIADVMGKGFQAALISFELRTLARATADLGSDPGVFLSEVNRQITSDLTRLDMFITAQAIYLPYHSHEIVLAAAGHCPLIIRSHDGIIQECEHGSLPLGLNPAETYTSVRLPAHPGDTAFMITDGLYESFAPGVPRFGFESFKEAVSSLQRVPNDSATTALFQHLARIREGITPEDDQTLLSIDFL